MGVTNTLRFFFLKEFVDHPLKESSVRICATKYKKELALRSKYDKDMMITRLESEKRGPGKELNSQVQEYVKALRENGVWLIQRL